MRLYPRPHISTLMLLASAMLAGCLSKTIRVEPPVELSHERYSIDFHEDDEFDDLPEAGDTGMTEGTDEE